MAASNPVPQAETTISPKVPAAAKGSAYVGLAFTVLGVVIAAIATYATPGNLGVLGLWALPASAAIQAGASAYAAWKRGYDTRDPLRDMTPVINPVTVIPSGGETTDGVAAGTDLPPDYIPDGTGSHRADV